MNRMCRWPVRLSWVSTRTLDETNKNMVICCALKSSLNIMFSKGSGATGSASVSKTGGWGFKSLLPCEIGRPSGRPPNDEGVNVSDNHELSGKRAGRTSPITFYRQSVAELRKVIWPTRPQLVNYFFVVLVFVLIMMGIVAGLYYGFGKAMFWIFA